MFKKYTIIALGALMLGGQASGMGSWARKLWAPSAVAAASVYTSKTTLCEEKPGCWQWFKAKMGWTPNGPASMVPVRPQLGISGSILHVYARMRCSLDKNALFTGEKLDGGNLKIAPVGYDIFSGKGSDLGFKTTIYGSSEELSHPGAKVEANGHVSRDGITSGWNKEGYPSGSRTGFDYDRFGTIKATELNELLTLRTSILLAVEKARTKEQQKMIDSEVVQGDSYFGPGNNGWKGVVRADGTILYSPTITPDERERREKLSEVRLDLRTKCFAPVFYGKDNSSGSMSCVTAYRPEDLEKM